MKPLPAFVVVCGDLVQAYPTQPEQAPQVEDFKRIFQKIHNDVKLVCVCGNHDVGDRPTPQTITTYKGRFGDDYFSFWCRGAQFFVLNSQLIKEPSSYPEGTARQDIWLEDVLKERKEYLEGLMKISIFPQNVYILTFENELIIRYFFASGYRMRREKIRST